MIKNKCKGKRMEESDLYKHRCLKFRAKTKGNEWVYGYYVYTYPNEHRIFGKDRTSIEVIPETVGQFTGSLDCAGNEIYEGDIVTCYNTYPFGDGEDNRNYHGVVIWHQGGFVVKIVRSAETTTVISEVNRKHIDDVLFFCMPEVIGNIHDNKELLIVDM